MRDAVQEKYRPTADRDAQEDYSDKTSLALHLPSSSQAGKRKQIVTSGMTAVTLACTLRGL